MKYGIMKAPPPFSAAWPGKRKKLPSPTAEPATARMTPTRLVHWLRSSWAAVVIAPALDGPSSCIC